MLNNLNIEIMNIETFKSYANHAILLENSSFEGYVLNYCHDNNLEEIDRIGDDEVIKNYEGENWNTGIIYKLSTDNYVGVVENDQSVYVEFSQDIADIQMWLTETIYALNDFYQIAEII